MSETAAKTSRISNRTNHDVDDITQQIRSLSQKADRKFITGNAEYEQLLALVICSGKSSQKWGPRWLSQSGFKCELVADPADALSVARSISPDAILVDAGLTDSNGQPIYRTLQNADDLDTTIVALCDSRQQINDALEAGVADIGRKPLNWQLVSRRLKTCVARRRMEKEQSELRNILTRALDLADSARNKLRDSEAFERLTGLPNRTKFLDLLSRGISAAESDRNSVALFSIGFARFRLIAEALGQANSDHILAEIGQRLNECLRRTGDFQNFSSGLRTAAVGNIGSERFGLMLTCSGEGQSAVALQNLIMTELQRPLLVDGQLIHLSPCIGIAHYPENDAGDANGLLLRAESAMVQAKKLGCGYKFYRAEDDKSAIRRLRIEQRLHQALEGRELRVAYQPLNTVVGNQVIGVEALLRWPQPDGSFISPEEFVPIAEECGLMGRTGRFVLDEACRQLKEWENQGVGPLRMSVNVSKRQLLTDGFREEVENFVKIHGIEPNNLDLELSERGVLSNNREVLDTLLWFKKRDITLSIDDFGTGDAAVAYLKELPIDVLKIDRSYIRKLVDAGREYVMTAAIIAMGQKLNLTVIAEGVETSEQLDILTSLGCDLYQGFYHSPAVTPDEIVRLIGKREADENK